jgi:hypothetical protein
MRRWWWWLGLAFVAWKVLTTVFWALNRPWRWDGNQILFVFFLACLGFVVLFWIQLWFRGGRTAVQERWANIRSMPEIMASRPRDKVYRWSLVFWIVFALALTFVFTLRQQQLATGHQRLTRAPM